MTGIHAYTREEQIDDQTEEPADTVRWFCRGCGAAVDAVVVDDRRIETKICCPDCGETAIVPDDTMDDHLEFLEEVVSKKQ